MEIVKKYPRGTVKGKNIYVVITAAGRIEQVRDVIIELKEGGANLFIFATVKAMNLIKPLEDLGLPIYNDFNWSGPRRGIPEEDIVLVAPCTFNTINKLRFGLADNYATTITQTAIAKGKPVLVVPAYNELWRHPQNQETLDVLSSWGVRIVWPDIKKAKVGMIAIGKILDCLYLVNAKIIYDSVQVTSLELVKILDEARSKYLPIFQEIGRQQEKEGTNTMSNGNYSVRLGDWMLIKSSGSELGNLSAKDLSLVKIDEEKRIMWVGDRIPSSDAPMHVVYYLNTDYKAIAHSHCPSITYRESLEHLATPEYIRYGSFDSIVPTIEQVKGQNGFLIIRYHGEIGMGDTIEEAYLKINRYFNNDAEENK